MSDTKPTTPPLDLSNAERLRAHLSKDSLAATLLAAWEAGDTAGAQARMLAALTTFHVSYHASGGHGIPAK